MGNCVSSRSEKVEVEQRTRFKKSKHKGTKITSYMKKHSSPKAQEATKSVSDEVENPQIGNRDHDDEKYQVDENERLKENGRAVGEAHDEAVVKETKTSSVERVSSCDHGSKPEIATNSSDVEGLPSVKVEEPKTMDDRVQVESGESKSKRLRLEGNKHYNLALGCQFNMGVRKDNLTSAVQSFNKALSEAETPDEFASAAKNCAAVNREMGKTLVKLNASISTVKFYYSDSIAHYSKAVKAGNNVKGNDWTDHLIAAYGCCLQEFVELIQEHENQSPKQRVKDIEALMAGMQDEFTDQVFRVTCYIKIANTMMIDACECIQNNDFKVALSILADSYRPVEEAKMITRRHGREDHDLDELVQDLFKQRCIAESMQAIQTGDTLFEDVLKGREALDMDGVFDVIDWYKKAIILTRENEVELEAIALSKLGTLYGKVLHQKLKAKENFMRSIQLAHSLHPRVFTTETWFREATEAVNRYQQEQRDKEEEEKKIDRSKYLEELKEELAALKKIEEKSYIDLIIYVYEKHPPKKGEITMPNKEEVLKFGNVEKKKLLQKAIVHYHPDKQDKEEYGKKWYILCEEITKTLTVKYECFK